MEQELQNKRLAASQRRRIYQAHFSVRSVATPHSFHKAACRLFTGILLEELV
jgi:hypothetical protein